MTRIYEIDGLSTADEQIAEIFHYLKKMRADLETTGRETQAALVEKQTVASGYAVRIKAALADFVQKHYGVPVSELAAGSYGAGICRDLDKIIETTFYFEDAALNLQINELKENLRCVSAIVAGLPVKVAALDAGEDEEK